MSKSIVVKLSPDSQSQLKQSGYSLCFAKKVNDVFNVVWRSYSKYLSTTTFTWTPEYEVFGTNTYKDAVKVQADTNVVPVELGQKCTLDESGVMGDAVTGDNQMGITIINQYGPIHSGVSQVCSIGGVQSTSPIYISKETRASGNILLTPKEKVMIWFQSNVETSTIFEEAKSRSVEIDLTNLDERTVSYDFESGKWSVDK